MNVRSKERFNGFWVALFSLMVGYLIYFFIYSNTKIISLINPDVKNFVGLFFMTSCMSAIYLILNYMLEKKLPNAFLYVLWGHYFILFFIVNFCLVSGESGFKLNLFDKLTYTGVEFIMLVFKSTALFLPVGYMIRKEKFERTLIIVILLILTIELAQYALNVGYFDINEIIFSFFGVYIGYLSFRTKKKKKRGRPAGENSNIYAQNK